MREKNPHLSPALEQVVMTALAKGPQQRFANVQAFVNALEQASQQIISNVTSLPAYPMFPETAVANESRKVKASPQEQNRTTVFPASFYTTQLSGASSIGDSHDNAANESVKERQIPILPTLPTQSVVQSLSQTSLHDDISSLAAIPATNRIFEGGNIPSKQVSPPGTSDHLTRKLPTGRKRVYFLSTLLLVLVVLSGSLVFEFQQFNTTKARTPTSTPLVTGAGTDAQAAEE